MTSNPSVFCRASVQVGFNDKISVAWWDMDVTLWAIAQGRIACPQTTDPGGWSNKVGSINYWRANKLRGLIHLDEGRWGQIFLHAKYSAELTHVTFEIPGTNSILHVSLASLTVKQILLTALVDATIVKVGHVLQMQSWLWGASPWPAGNPKSILGSILIPKIPALQKLTRMLTANTWD